MGLASLHAKTIGVDQDLSCHSPYRFCVDLCYVARTIKKLENGMLFLGSDSLATSRQRICFKSDQTSSLSAIIQVKNFPHTQAWL